MGSRLSTACSWARACRSCLEQNAAALALVGIGLWHLYYFATYTLDDAYITFRYSRNLARGLGLVYNPGDYVKGYSNTLYTVLMTGPEIAHRDPIGFSKALGMLSFVALCWLGASSFRRAQTPTQRDRGLWFLLLMAASTALAVHCMSGLETGLHSALLMAAVLRRVHEQEKPGRSPVGSALLFVALVLSRPEGIVLFAAMALHDVLWRVRARRFSVRELLFYALPPLAYATELSLSLWYYGAPFPQTYYAKTAAVHGLTESLRVLATGAARQLSAQSYLSLGLTGTGLGRLCLLAIPLALVARARRRRNAALTLVLIAQLVFIVRAESDWAPAFRFGVPMLPLLFLLLVDALGTAASWARRYERPVGWLLACIALASVLPEQWQSSVETRRVRYVNADNKLIQGAMFATLAEPGSTLASFDIGGHGYAAGGFDILDAFGLTVRETVGCSRRNSPRCTRYAELVQPELIRLHSNPRFDGYIAKAVKRQAPYLTLDKGKYLLERSLVFTQALPATAAAVSGGAAAASGEAPAAASGGAAAAAPVAASGDAHGEARQVATRAAIAAAGGGDVGAARLVAVALPSAVPEHASFAATLYWARGEDSPEPLKRRRLAWHDAHIAFSAEASPAVLTHVEGVGDWNPSELYADRVTLRGPARPGRYQLQVAVDRERAVVADIDVLPARGLAARASTQVAQAQRALAVNNQPGALELFRNAVLLAPSSAREPYQSVVAALAQRLRAMATRQQRNDPKQALRTVQSASRLLHRAFWESGHASQALRREIDANAALRKQLIDSELEHRTP